MYARIKAAIIAHDFSAPACQFDRDASLHLSGGLRDQLPYTIKTSVEVVNPHASEAREAEIGIAGKRESGTVTTLSHTDIHAHNSFQSARVVNRNLSLGNQRTDARTSCCFRSKLT